MNNKLTLQEVADILLLKDIRPIQSYIEKGLIPEIAVDKENFTIDAQILAQRMGVLDFNEPFISEAKAKEILGIDNKSPISYFCEKHGINMYRLSSSSGSRFLFRKSDLLDKNKVEIKSMPFALENIIRDECFQEIFLFLEKIKKTNLVYSSDKQFEAFFLHLKGKSIKEIVEEISTPEYPVSASWVSSRIKKYTSRIKATLKYFHILIDTFQDTKYFGMNPDKILEDINNLEKENQDLKISIDRLKRGETDPVQEQEKPKTEEEVKREKLLNTPLKQLDFSVRLYNCLNTQLNHWLKIESPNLNDVLELYKSNNLLRIRNFGKKSLNELGNFLLEKGLISEI